VHQGFDYLLANRAVLAARQVCDCLCKRNNDFVSVDCVWLPRRCGILSEKFLDQFDSCSGGKDALRCLGLLAWSITPYSAQPTGMTLIRILPRLQARFSARLSFNRGRARECFISGQAPASSLYGPDLPCSGSYSRRNMEHLESCQADRTYLVRRHREC
jgi:hypothetical protein